MSDQALRDLDRRRRETGSPDDDARWLLARVRAGGLARDRLELAAELGHPGALLALGRAAGPPVGPLGPWVAALARRDVRAAVRVGLACARLAASAGAPQGVGDLLAAIEAWVREPLAAPAFRVAAQHDLLAPPHDRLGVLARGEPTALRAPPPVRAGLDVAVAVVAATHAAFPGDLTLVPLAAPGLHPGQFLRGATERAVEALRGSQSGGARTRAVGRLRDAIAAEVVPWLLDGGS